MEGGFMNRIFISYRRSSGIDIASRLNDFFTGKGFNVFFDIEKMEIGKRFDQQIAKNIVLCDYFLLILSKGALDDCFKPEDWVRKEIETALNLKNIKIIPIITRDFEYPHDLPNSIIDIKYIHGFTYEPTIARSMTSLLEALNNHNVAVHKENPIKEQLLQILNDFYNILIQYRNALRDNNSKLLKKAHSQLSKAQDFYTFYERYRRSHIEIAIYAQEVVVSFNTFVEKFNAWNENKNDSICTFEVSSAFNSLLDTVLDNISKLEN